MAAYKIKDSYYEEIRADDAYDALMEYANEVGYDVALDDLARSIGDEQLAEHLAYIFRMADFDSRYIIEEDEEVEDEEEFEDYEIEEDEE